MWYALITLCLVVFIAIAYLGCLWGQGLCLSCSQLYPQGLALQTSILSLCSNWVEVVSTGYGFTSSLALDIKSLLRVLLPPYLMLRAKRQSHRSHRKIQFLQKTGHKQQFSFLSAQGGACCLLHHQEAWRKGGATNATPVCSSKFSSKASFWNPPNTANIWLAESRGIVETSTADLTRPLVLHPRVNSLFPFLHFPPTCRRVGKRKARNPPLPLHQASILPFLSPESSSRPSDHRRLVAYT